MAYRRSERYQRRIRAMREGKARARMEREPVERWQPPDLRRRLIVEDYDSGEVARTVIDMHRTPRIDSYRANSYGGYHVEIAHDQGWASGQRVRLLLVREGGDHA